MPDDGHMPRRARSPDRVNAADVVAFIHKHIFVPEGRFVARPLQLDPWQCAEIERIYDNPAGTRRAFLSFGRKNGKTSIALSAAESSVWSKCTLASEFAAIFGRAVA